MIIYYDPNQQTHQRILFLLNDDDVYQVPVKNIAEISNLKSLPAIEINGKIIAQGLKSCMNYLENNE